LVLQDDLFGVSKRAKLIEIVEKKKKKKNDSGAAPLPSLGLGLLKTNNKQSVKIEALSMAKYLPGCQALGIVLSIAGNSAVLSLPGGCIGTLALAEVSDVIHKKVAENNDDIATLSQLLRVNQTLRVSVISNNDENRRIVLSARLSLINRGLALKHLYTGQVMGACVVSKEDHG
jgi:hypothetical protein